MGVDKCRDMYSEEVIGRYNGVIRIVGFMGFGKEVQSGGVGNRDMEDFK